MDNSAVMRLARETGYSAEDVKEACQIMRAANVPEDQIAMVLRLLATAATLDGVGSPLAALARRAAEQAEHD
ncbi:MAG: hypothetical protein ACE5PT_12970 [Gemmatimonadales bacterium]